MQWVFPRHHARYMTAALSIGNMCTALGMHQMYIFQCGPIWTYNYTYVHVYARWLGDYTRYIYTFNAQQKGKLDRGMRLWDLKWQHTREGGQHVASGYRAGIEQHAQLQRPLPAADRFPAFVSCWSVWPYRCGKI